jgi:hypothetical protein
MYTPHLASAKDYLSSPSALSGGSVTVHHNYAAFSFFRLISSIPVSLDERVYWLLKLPVVFAIPNIFQPNEC